MSQNLIRDRKFFWKEVGKVDDGNVENCNIIKDRTESLAVGEIDVRKIQNEYFEDMYNVDTEEWNLVNICGFDCDGRDIQWKNH